MDCLTTDRIVAYLRGRDVDARAVEDHLRVCPKCALEALTAREALRGLKNGRTKKPPSSRWRAVVLRRRRSGWLPWVAAAVVLLVAGVLWLTRDAAPEDPGGVAAPRPAPAPVEPVPAPAPKPELVRRPETPDPEPVPEPEPAPKAPRVVRRPEKPPTPPAPKPDPEPAPPAPPKKEPAPRTVVERPRVGTIVRATSDAAGRAVFAGETVETKRTEFLALALDGFGTVYFREDSRAEIAPEGRIALHEGGLFADLEPRRRLPPVATPEVEVDAASPRFGIQVGRSGTDVTVAEGFATAGGASVRGPARISLRPGKDPETGPPEPGFASWIPAALAARSFTGWFEAEAFQTMRGFEAREAEGSGGRAAVQIAAQGAAIGDRLALPYKGRYVAWVRVRQYAAREIALALRVNGRAVPAVRLKGQEGASPWRWVGPVPLTADRAEIILSAMTRWAFRENDERRSFPVVADLVAVSSDLEFIPPERLPEERADFGFRLGAPGR